MMVDYLVSLMAGLTVDQMDISMVETLVGRLVEHWVVHLDDQKVGMTVADLVDMMAVGMVELLG